MSNSTEKSEKTNKPSKVSQTAPFGTHLPYTDPFEDDKDPILNIEGKQSENVKTAIAPTYASPSSTYLPPECPETIVNPLQPNELPNIPDCVFCKIGTGKLPCWLVYQDKWCVVFLDHQPLSEGHLLVIPRNHWRLLGQMPSHVMAHIGSLLPRLASALMETLGKKDYNILQNNGQAAGQVVHHVHFHIVPRQIGDESRYKVADGIKRLTLTREGASDLVSRLKDTLSKRFSLQSKL